jgi:GrpB-like predicted nucleotidyltransferase (UPF0157 family)
VADQRVELVDYDPGWRDRFAEQQPLVETLLRPWLAGPVEHVGSTAVPGLRAKPVIDMLAPVTSLAGAQAAVPVLAGAGQGRAGCLTWGVCCEGSARQRPGRCTRQRG